MYETKNKLSALFATGMCGYLTIATSAIDVPPCPEVANVSEVRLELDTQARAETSWWLASGFTPSPITSWRISVSPPADIVYIPDSNEAPVPIVDAGPPSQTPTQADAPPSSGTTSDVNSTSAVAPLPAFVQQLPGELRVVCNQRFEPCREVRFSIIPLESGAAPREIIATALRPGCSTNAPITEVTLKPWQP